MKHYFVTLNPKMAERRRWLHRRPRTKKRRIRAKWAKRPENWRSEPFVVQTTLLLGPAWSHIKIDPNAVMLEMHPNTFEKMGPCLRDGSKVTVAEPLPPFAFDSESLS